MRGRASRDAVPKIRATLRILWDGASPEPSYPEMIRLSILLLGITALSSCTARVSGPDAADAAADGAALDGSPPDPGGHAACDALTLMFVGCDVERRAECVRELAHVSAKALGYVEDAASCAGAGGTFRWPAPPAACTPTSVPPVRTLRDSWYHGSCEMVTGNVASVTEDPGFPPCGGDAGLPACFFHGTIP